MGKQIVRFSRWSCRSLFQVYSRILTLIFALFCVASGQLPRTSSNTRANETVNFKGTVYRASDSTALKNIRLFFECMAPLYGINPDYGVIVPMYGPAPLIDSVTTDENGSFEVNVMRSFTRNIRTETVIDASGKRVTYFSDPIFIQEGVDSSYTIYLREQTVAAHPEVSHSKKNPILPVFQGNLFEVRIPEWKGSTTDAVVVNSKGQRISVLTANNDGVLRWDTRGAARGVYFLKLSNNENNINIKMLVK